MTLQRDGTGTGRYIPPSGPGSSDVFGTANPSFDYGQKQIPPYRFETYRKQNGKLGWRFMVFTLIAGLNMQKGDMEAAHARAALSELDHRVDGQVILPQLKASAATPDPVASSRARIYGVNVLGGLVMAADANSGATQSVFKETSDTDPTVTQLTVSAASISGNLLSLNALSFAGAEPYLVVGSASSSGQRVYDTLASSPHQAGTMHTDLQSLYGAVQVSLPGRPILLYGIVASNSAIGYLAGGAAISAQPTTAQTGTALGGWALGEQSVGGAPLRVNWVFPQIGAFGGTGGTDSTFTLAAWKQAKAKVESTNQRGTDRDAYKFPLPYIGGASNLRDGIFAHDDQRAYFHNNRGFRYKDLGIFRDVYPNSDRQMSIQGHWIRDDEVYVEINEIASPSGSGVTKRRILWYSFEYREWFTVMSDETLSTTGRLTMGAGRSLPASDQTGYLHCYSDGAWKRIYQPSPLVNPFSLRQTSGAGASTGASYEAGPLSTQMPQMVFPGQLATRQKVVTGMGFMGDIDSGGSGASVKIEAGGVEHTFIYGYGQQSQYHAFKNNAHRFSFLAPKITLTRGSTAQMTPQGLPFYIEGEFEDDDRPVRV